MCGEIGMASNKMSKEAQAREDQYRAEDDFRTIQRANEVTSDSNRMKHVRKHAARQMKLAHTVLRKSAR